MRVLSGFVGVLSPVLLAGQSQPAPAGAAVPSDLAAALATAGGFRTSADPEILVGQLPAWAASVLQVPAGARVLGSAVSGSSVTAILQVIEFVDSTAVRMNADLRARGWTARPSRPAQGGFRFVDSGPTQGAPLPFTLCNGDQMIWAAVGARRGGVSNLVVRIATYSPEDGGSPCSRRQWSGPDAGYPTLFNPPGATDARSMRPRSCAEPDIGRAGGTSTSIRTLMNGQEIIAHYEQQLLKQGWTSATFSSQILHRLFTRTDSLNRPVKLLLTVGSSFNEVGCHDASFMMTEYGDR